MKHKVPLLLLALTFFCTNACKKDDYLNVESKEELEEKLRQEMDENGLSSLSYCIVKNDQLVLSGALGYADKSISKLATDSTRYLIASVSKTITGVALMQLVDQQLISLDEDINLHLPFSVRNPNYPNEKITYRMLLSHTSSISDEFQDGLVLDCYGTDCAMSLEQFFNAVFTNTGAYHSAQNFTGNAPGTAEEYSNLGSALVGYLVERISQEPFDQYCKTHIFTPLGMNKTEWRLANIPLSELAIPYSSDITNPNPHYTFPDYPNGGLRTTVLDLSKFLRMAIQNGNFNGSEIVSQAAMNEMKTLQFGSDEQCLAFYYSTINGRKLLGHNGGEKGVSTEMYYDPQTNVGVIVFNNDDDTDLEAAVSLLFSYGEKQP